jgi:hypothetical protein
MRRFETLFFRVAGVVCALVAALALVYALATVSSRLYEGVEGELAFEAARIRGGMPLYVDPRTGAFEYGKVPARFYALYTPVWPALVALAPAGATKVFARVFSLSAWLGTLAWSVSAAKPGHRRSAFLFAAFAGGCFFLVRGAVAGTADTFATLLATVALLRVARCDTLHPRDAFLLALAPLVKPNVVGVLVGVCLVDVARGVSTSTGRRTRAASLGTVAVTLLGGCLVFEAVSAGEWLTHLLSSSAQELRTGRWMEQFGSRALLLGAPQAAIALLAHRRGTASPYATGALVVSTLWAVLGMAKSGSATNYWLEPTAATLVVIATSEGAAFERAASWVGASFGVLNAAVSFPALCRMWTEAEEEARALPALRAACPLAAGETIASHDVGIELELTGRLWIPPFQTTYLLRHGRFPLAIWQGDLALPELRYFVTRGPYFEAAPPSDAEGKKERLAFLLELRAQIDRSFVLKARVGPFRVYRRRDVAP